MKKTSCLLLLSVLISTFSLGQTKKIQSDNVVNFTIKNAGLKVDGSFKGLAGSILFDPDDVSKAAFDVSIDANTINTGINARDNHLRKEEYFDVAKYPKISFKSKKIDRNNNGYTVTGTFHMKGKSKEVSFPFTYTETAGTGIFKGSVTLNRLDFGVGGSSWVMSDEVTLLLNIKVLTP